MQNDNHDNDNTSSPSQGQGSGSGDDDKNKTSRGSWRGWSAGDSFKIPTKTHDGGGMDIPTNPNANGEGEQQSTNGEGGGSENEATTRTMTTATSRPDNFLTYSDTDTRMRALLGLDPPANGEEQEDWRRHVGFQGLRERRNNDGAAPLVNGNGEAAALPTRQTRLSWEVHPSAFFDNMIMQRGELGDGPLQVDEQPPRRVERQQRGHGHEGENQNDDEE